LKDRGGSEKKKATVEKGTHKLKDGLARMLKGGVIMDVTTPQQARIAEKAGAVAVMALERVPADIRAVGGVARMADPLVIERIQKAVTIPVMAKVRIGHFAEAQVLEALGVDFIDESEVLTPADDAYHVDKTKFKVPFVCGARNLGEALRRINEGATMIRTKGEAGSGDIVQAVRHVRTVASDIENAKRLSSHRLEALAREYRVPYELLKETVNLGRLPVVNFAAGGIATPADASLMMQMGVDGIFVGSGIFKSRNPPLMANAMVKATNFYREPAKVAEVSKGLGDAMRGLDTSKLRPEERLQERGW